MQDESHLNDINQIFEFKIGSFSEQSVPTGYG
jgi:hypothetical protein